MKEFAISKEGEILCVHCANLTIPKEGCFINPQIKLNDLIDVYRKKKVKKGELE